MGVLNDEPEVEYIGGRPYPRVGSGRTHAVVEGRFGILLQDAAGEHGAVGVAWRFQVSPGNEFVTDAAYVSYERLRSLSEEECEEPPFAPDIAVEVRSPSDKSALTEEKIRQYLSHGAVLVLDVDPVQQVLYAHSYGGVKQYHNRDAFVSDAVPWLRFDVAEVFADLKIPR